MDVRIEKTMENLRRNRMEAYYVESRDEVPALVSSLLKKGDTVTHGGSETLKQTGVIDLLRSGDYNYLDRSAAKNPEEVAEVYAKSFSADAYLTSCNAVTENGELYNVDEAIRRVKTKAAPPNTVRLGLNTPCAKTGECVSLRKDAPEMCEGCRGESRICCNYAVCAYQRHANRIKVILVGEELGY